jgi:hypothetical protein
LNSPEEAGSKMRVRVYSLLVFCIASIGLCRAQETPRIVKTDGGARLLVDGKSFLIRGGELGNSSAGTAAQADAILPKVARLHVNTVLMPVAWEQTEPTEGSFDFSILDHWIETAREYHLHLVLLWFGSWKNGYSEYAPSWVKRDTHRFPRAIAVDGTETEILSTLGTETLKADTRAFAALMAHVKQKDTAQHTVLMVQVENEVGFLGRGRDRSAEANQLFACHVPDELVQGLRTRRDTLSPELRSHFEAKGGTWSEVFGDAADEVFMAWHYARFIGQVAAVGKQAYDLPMYLNAQLPAPQERAGEYPSGGPHPYYQDVYRVGAPAIDFYAPDIYWPDFAYWVGRYAAEGNPVFVPEARMDAAPFNALYAYGQAGAFGFSPFDIDGLQPSAEKAPAMAQTFGAVEDLEEMLIPGQAAGKTRGIVLHADSPRPTQTIALGGYLMEATLARTWPSRTLEAQDGAMLVIQTGADEFYITGRGLTVNFSRDTDVDSKLAGIASIERMKKIDGAWVAVERMNGDQSNQGRQLLMDANDVGIFRVKLYAVERISMR